MSDADERELIRRAQSGDLSARNALIEHNLPFICKCVMRSTPKTVDYREYISHGAEIFATCIARFDLRRSVRLLTFSGIAIDRRMWRIWATRGLIRVPQRSSTTVEDFESLRERAMTLGSLDRSSRKGGRGGTMAERIEAPSEDEAPGVQQVLLSELAAALARLGREHDPRLPEIMRKRAAGHTLKEVGKELGLCRERVRQLEDRGLELLKGMMGARAAA